MKITNILSKNNLIKSGLILITLSTVLTSTLGVVKVAKSFSTNGEKQTPQVKAEEVEGTSTEGDNFNTEIQNSNNPSNEPTKDTATNPPVKTAKAPIGNSTNPTPPASVSLAAVNPTVSGTTNANACIITLFNKQYDVSSLINTHPGGNVFACGADNTSIYQKAHGTDVSRMQQYLVVQGVPGNPGNTTTPGTSFEDKDLEEQKEKMEDDFEEAKKEHEEDQEDEEDKD